MADTKSIFISYRHDDSAGYAGRIYDRLREKFGDEYIFMDVANIEMGDDWDQRIRDAVSSCDVLLAIIGKRWLTSPDKYGRRRLDDENDYVALEISTALERKVTVIPILVDRAELPEKEGLPSRLTSMLGHQKCEVRHDKFHRDVDDLLGTLDGLGINPQRAETITGVANAQLGPITLKAEGTISVEEDVSFGPEKILSTFTEISRDFDQSNWEQSRLGDIAIVKRGKPTSSEQRREGEYPYYGISGVIEHVDYYDFDGPHLLINGVGSNLLKLGSSIVTRVDGKFAISSRLYALQLQEHATILSLDFLATFLSSIDYRPLVVGAVQPFLPVKHLMNLIIPIPSLDEQLTLVNAINGQLREVGFIRTKLQEQLETVEALEAAVIRQMRDNLRYTNDQ